MTAGDPRRVVRLAVQIFEIAVSLKRLMRLGPKGCDKLPLGA